MSAMRNLFCPICHERGPHIVNKITKEATCRLTCGVTRPWNELDKLDMGIQSKPEAVVVTRGDRERRI